MRISCRLSNVRFQAIEIEQSQQMQSERVHNNRYRIRDELAFLSLSAVLTAALGTRMSRHNAPDVVFVCFVSCDRLVLVVHTRSVSFYVALSLSLLLRRCCCCSLSRSCLWADYGCLRKCVDTSRYLSMCLCDFRLQLLSLSGSVVLLLLRLRPLLAALLLWAAQSFSTCTRLTDAVIICAFCTFVRLSCGCCGSAASLLASLFAFCTRVIM